MDPTEVATTPPEHSGHAFERRREGYTMALYVAICLLAVLTGAVRHDTVDQATVIELIWGTTLGLALAHWFAFRLSSRLARSGQRHRHDYDVGLAQLAGAGFVAVISTLPVVLLDTRSELDAARIVLAGFIGVIGYSVARANEASQARAVAYGAAELLAAAVVVLVKNVLSGH